MIFIPDSMNYQCTIQGPGISLNLNLTSPDDVDAIAATLQSIRLKLKKEEAKVDRIAAITGRSESLLGIKQPEISKNKSR